jgi:hypothetical protein
MGLHALLQGWLYLSHILYTFLNKVLNHRLPSIQLQSFLEWTRTSFEPSLAEFYTFLLEEHIQVALEMLEVGICSSLVYKTDQRGSMMLKTGDCAGQGTC